MIRLALIGTGRWGTAIARTLGVMEGIELAHVFGRPEKASDYRSLLKNPEDVQGVIIATPGSTHAEVALPFIGRGMPVFVEKPVALNVRDAGRMERAAAESGAIVFAGHLHLYNPAYRKARDIVRKSGHIRAIVCEGVSDGPRRADMSVLWDWGSHDVYLALDLMGTLPDAIQVWGIATAGALHDFTVTRLHFPGNAEIIITNSWLSPEKRKRVAVTCEEATVVFEDTAEKKVAVSAHGKVSYPRYGKGAALACELAAFIRCIRNGSQPPTPFAQGASVVRILAAAEKSIARGGAPIKI